MTGWKMSEHGVPDSRLTVLNREENHVQPNGVSSVRWRCRCDCGNEIVTKGIQLRKGQTLSCGCFHKESAAKRGRENSKYNKYDLTGEFGIGYTPEGEEFYFDLEDYEKIKNYCWALNNDGYVVTNDKKTRKRLRFHRLILSPQKGEQVDHINHKRNDNRKSHLRIVSNAQNSMNRSLQSNNTSGITGVYWSNPKKRWTAEIMVGKKKIYLGIYKNLSDAVKARKEAEKKYFGEYSYDNSMSANI